MHASVSTTARGAGSLSGRSPVIAVYSVPTGRCRVHRYRKTAKGAARKINRQRRSSVTYNPSSTRQMTFAPIRANNSLPWCERILTMSGKNQSRLPATFGCVFPCASSNQQLISNWLENLRVSYLLASESMSVCRQGRIQEPSFLGSSNRIFSSSN